MIDVQNQPDTREIPLQKVGIKNLRYPIQVKDRANGKQNTAATVELYVNLPHHFKGTHMSRFVEIFHKNRENLTMKGFIHILQEIRNSLKAEQSYGKITFPFFIEKTAPVSAQKSMLEYSCSYEATVTQTKNDFYLCVSVPVTTLCPCSKALCKKGAHNQRGNVTVKVQNDSFFWLEDIIETVENAASCQIFSLLKREDEQFVTEHAYNNPRFVEDIVREVYLGLQNFCKNGKCETPFTYFSIEAENFESIHNHNAFAFAEFTS